jgi:hypothetical protein
MDSLKKKKILINTMTTDKFITLSQAFEDQTLEINIEIKGHFLIATLSPECCQSPVEEE